MNYQFILALTLLSTLHPVEHVTNPTITNTMSETSITVANSKLEPLVDIALEIHNDKMIELIDEYKTELNNASPALFSAGLEPLNFLKSKSTQIQEVITEELLKELSEVKTEYAALLRSSIPKREVFLESSYTAAFEYAREIEDKYGIEIDYGRDALVFWKNYVDSSSRPNLNALTSHLAILDEELSKYPDDLFYTDLRGINISLVTGFEDLGEKLKGDTIVGLAQEREDGIQYPNHNADFYMVLKMNVSDFRKNIHHELGHLIAFKIDPTYEEGLYPHFSEIYSNLPPESNYNFYNHSKDIMNATHFNQYQAHDVHEYLSVLYSEILMNESNASDLFPLGSFLNTQARLLISIISSEIPAMSELDSFSKMSPDSMKERLPVDESDPIKNEIAHIKEKTGLFQSNLGREGE